MIHFYFHPTPNPAKVALFLEEAKLPYEQFNLPFDALRWVSLRCSMLL